ncbi:MAG: YceI family protein [Acidimicrobiales bacterium]
MKKSGFTMKKSGFVVGLLLVLGATAFFTRDQWAWYLEDDTVVSEEVVAPQLEPVQDERLFRIDPSQSSASYAVGEKLIGRDRNVAVGTTSAIGGDIIIATDVAASKIGTIVVNVELFTSDNKLRDKRIRHDFLESNHYKFVEFDPTGIEGLPETIVEGKAYPLTITGDLTVKETTNEELFKGSITLDGDTLSATMSATILMSTYDVGPISIMALVTTEDEIELTFDFVALDATTADEPRDPATELVALDQPTWAADSNFSSAVLPIVENKCASCHVEGGIGHSTLALETVGDVAGIADGIQLVTEGRYMPPWPASDQSLAFHGDWSLSDDEINTLANWSASGATIDVEPTQLLNPTATAIEPLELDQTVRQAEPYSGDPEVKDDYRCQIVDPQVTETTWVKGYNFEPEIDEVHHVIVFLGNAEARDQADGFDGKDGKPGWTCYGLTNLTQGEVDGFGGWVPGQRPRTYPDGIGIKLEAGDFFIVQTHFHYDHEAPADQSPMLLDLADESDGELRAVHRDTYLTPVEIPCHVSDADLPACDRDVELKRITDEFGGLAPLIPRFVNNGCGVSHKDYEHLTNGVASSVCDKQVGLDGTLFSVLAHMHELGSSYRMTLNPDTPAELVLLDIPTWSFEWQLTYEPVEDIRIKANDIIRFECAWDRSLQPTWEPKYVIWAEGTQDEMCFSTVSVIPDP